MSDSFSDEDHTANDGYQSTECSSTPPKQSPASCMYVECNDPHYYNRRAVLDKTLLDEYKSHTISLPRPWSKDLPIFLRPILNRYQYFPYNKKLYRIAKGEIKCDCLHVLPLPQITYTRVHDWPCGCTQPTVIDIPQCMSKYPELEHSSILDDLKYHEAGGRITCGSYKGVIIVPRDHQRSCYNHFLVPSRSTGTTIDPSSPRKRRNKFGKRTSLTDRKRYRYGDNKVY